MIFGKKKKIQLISDENGNMCITDGTNTEVVSKQTCREILEGGGDWQDGRFTPAVPGYVEWDLGGNAVGLQPANEAARTVFAAVKTRRGLFG